MSSISISSKSFWNTNDSLFCISLTWLSATFLLDFKALANIVLDLPSQTFDGTVSPFSMACSLIAWLVSILPVWLIIALTLELVFLSAILGCPAGVIPNTSKNCSLVILSFLVCSCNPALLPVLAALVLLPLL